MHDAVVVGAGLVGSWVAMELAKAGARVLVLDAGPLVTREQLEAAGGGEGLAYRAGRVLAGQGYLAASRILNRATDPFYVSRRANPYSHPSGKPFRWVRGRQVGGRGHTWGRIAVRLAPEDFAQWPIGYADLAPHYEKIERFLSLEGSADGIASVPDGVYARPHALVEPEKKFARAVEEKLGTRVIASRVLAYAPGRLSPMLEAALATGRVRLLANTVAARLTIRGREATHVVAVERESRHVSELAAGNVFLCASAIESVRLLLASEVADRSGWLGRGVMDHSTRWCTGTCEAAEFPPSSWFDLAKRQGVYVPGVVTPQGRFCVQGAIGRGSGDFSLAAFGEMRARLENRVTLSSRRDRWGVPIPHIDVSFAAEDFAIADAAERWMRDAASAAGLAIGPRTPPPIGDRIVDWFRERAIRRPGAAIHESGGARMGADPAMSVIDPKNRVWSAPNVRICDAACFPHLSFHNPTLTAMAIAARAARL